MLARSQIVLDDRLELGVKQQASCETVDDRREA